MGNLHSHKNSYRNFCKASNIIQYRHNRIQGQISVRYSRFHKTLTTNVPNFVAKFASSLLSSKVHNEIDKPVCKLRIWLASFTSGSLEIDCKICYLQHMMQEAQLSQEDNTLHQLELHLSLAERTIAEKYNIFLIYMRFNVTHTLTH
jgi:hypothetical protein